MTSPRSDDAASGGSPLPNALGVGAGKTGTTWLYACLDEHPEAFTPPLGETDFFSRRYYEGFDWYAALFEERAGEKAVVDLSPTYLIDPGAPARIHDWNPEVQLIFGFRNPIERAYSHYCMHLRTGAVSEDVDEEIAPQTRYMREGRYFRHVQRYLRHFSEEQMLRLVFDDLKSDPRAYLRRVFHFLDVDPAFEPSLLGRRYQQRKVRPRFQRLYNGLVAAQTWARKQVRSKSATRLIKFLRRNGYVDVFHRLNRGADFPALSEEKKRSMAAFYAEDVSALSEWLGRDLTHWLDPYLEARASAQKELMGNPEEAS